jgi:hypothetical protein
MRKLSPEERAAKRALAETVAPVAEVTSKKSKKKEVAEEAAPAEEAVAEVAPATEEEVSVKEEAAE